jgi:hypothetical protein
MESQVKDLRTFHRQALEHYFAELKERKSLEET